MASLFAETSFASLQRTPCPRGLSGRGPAAASRRFPLHNQNPPLWLLNVGDRSIRTHASFPTVPKALEEQSQGNVRCERFLQWLTSLGWESCQLELCDHGGVGVGFATRATAGGLAKGQVAVRVPQAAFMNVQTAARCQLLGPVVASGKLTEWQALCLHLLCERALGRSSFWFEYITLLPSPQAMAALHPLLWDEDDLAHALEGSSMKETLQKRVSYCREDRAAMLAAAASVVLPTGEALACHVTEGSTRWAAAVILSRAFSLQLPDDVGPVPGEAGGEASARPVITLVPWADMLNHSSLAGVESCLTFDPGDGFASLRSHRKYEGGDEVFDSYGPDKSPVRLFVDYGFVDEGGDNHAIDLPVSILGSTRGPENVALLTAVGLPPDEAQFTLTPAGADVSMLTWLRAAVATPEELSSVGWAVPTDFAAGGAGSEGGGTRGQPTHVAWSRGEIQVAARAMAKLACPVSTRNEAEVLKRLVTTCSTLLGGYPPAGQAGRAAACSELPEHLGLSPCSPPAEQRVLDAQFAAMRRWARVQAEAAVRSEVSALVGARRVVLKQLRAILTSK